MRLFDQTKEPSTSEIEYPYVGSVWKAWSCLITGLLQKILSFIAKLKRRV